MRARPRPNRRRGLIRAAIVVAILIALLVAAMLIVSSLLAPSVNAPTAPTTPGPQTPAITPGRVLTPIPTVKAGTPAPTVKAVTSATAVHAATPKATPKTAGTPVKDIAMASAGPPAKHAAASLLRRIAADRTSHHTAAPRRAAVFVGRGDAYRGRTLVVQDSVGQTAMRTVGRADPFVQPVWSTDQKSLYFVRVRQVRAMPGAEWTLWRWDSKSGQAVSLVTSRSLGLIPLGTRNGAFLYVLSRPADSIIEAFVHGRSRYVATLDSQPVSSAFLAPNGSGIAFAVPSSCSNCTVDIYDLTKLWIWYGPSGAPSDIDISWLANGAGLVTYRGHHLISMDSHAKITGTFVPPSTLPRRWTAPMQARVNGVDVALTDLVSGHAYVARRITNG